METWKLAIKMIVCISTQNSWKLIPSQILFPISFLHQEMVAFHWTEHTLAVCDWNKTTKKMIALHHTLPVANTVNNESKLHANYNHWSLKSWTKSLVVGQQPGKTPYTGWETKVSLIFLRITLSTAGLFS